MKQVRLNRAEVWIADHALPIFGIVAVAIVAGAIGITVVFMQTQKARNQVNVLKPQVTRVNKAICDKQSLDHSQRAERCAERIRVGLVNCRRSQPCRAALLAAITYPPPARSSAPSSTTATTTAPSPEGGGAQQPSNSGHQQPGPGKQPGHEGGQGGPPAASPPAPGPAAPEAGPPAESPANGAQGAPGGSSSSGADVEVCAEIVNTCAGVEVGLGR